MEFMHLNNKYIYLKQSTFPSSIGLSLIWTTGPGWDLDDLKEKKWSFFFFSLPKIAIQLQIHYNRNNDWKIKIYLQRLKTFQEMIAIFILLNSSLNWGMSFNSTAHVKNKSCIMLKKKSSINIYSEKKKSHSLVIQLNWGLQSRNRYATFAQTHNSMALFHIMT